MKKQPILPSNNLTLRLLLPLLLLATLWTCFIAPLPTQAQGGDEELWRTLETPFGGVGQVLEDKEGNIWVVSWTGQVVSSDGELTASDYEEIGELGSSITQTSSGANVSFIDILGEGLARFEQGDWVTYTIESTDGDLPGNNIEAALFDREGHLWLAVSENKAISDSVTTESAGVVRFDGETWQTFTVTNTNGGLASNSVNDIFEDAVGNLWFATYEGLSRYNGQNWEVVADKETLGNSTSQVFKDSRNRLWVSLIDAKTKIGVGHGVARSAPITGTGAVTGWQTFTESDGLTDDYVLSIAEDAEGNIWFGTHNGVSQFDGENWQTFNSDNSQLRHDLVLQVLPGYEQEMWATTGGGFVKYVRGEWQEFGSYQETTSIFKDSEGLVWFSHLDQGLDYYTGYRRQIFSKEQGHLGSNNINNLLEANNGVIWVGTSDGGVSHYQKGEWTTFTSNNSDLVSNNVENLFETNDDSIWASSCAGIDTYSLSQQSCDQGISRYKNGKWQVFNSESGDLNSNDVRDLFESSDGTVWVGMWGAGVSYYQKEKWHIFHEENGNPKDGYVWELFESSDQAIWIATTGGVSRYQNGIWETFSIESGDLKDNYIRYILESNDGAIWLETREGGISRYKNDKWQTFSKESEDLISNDLGYLREGADGAIWVWYSEIGGLSRYQDGKWEYIPNKDFTSYESENNPPLPSLIAQDGFAWTATNYDLVRSHPNIRAPWVEIVQVNFNPFTTTALTLADEERHRVSIDFRGHDLATHPKNLRYLYTLDNLSEDSNWQEATYNRPIIFEKLDSGEHTLLVKAIDEDGLESEPAKLEIIVEQPPLTPFEWFVRGLLGVVILLGLVNFGQSWWRQRRDIGHHFNPFIGEVAVKDPEMFFGRQEILHDVFRSIQATNFVIYGEKRIGKTSLLHQIDHHLSEMEGKHFDYLPFVVSLHAMSEERFFRDLMRKMVARIRSRGRYPAEGLFLECEQADMPYDSISFNGDLDSLQSALDAQNDLPLRMVLLVDEGDVLKRYSEDTLAQLRETFMVWAGDYLKIVLTCEGPDERAWTLDGSPWMSIFGKDYRLTPFTDEIARKLIVEPVPNYTYQEEAVERILQRSQLVPRHIQNICRETINEMLTDKTGTITLNHVESALPKVENLPAEITDEEEQE